MFRFKALGFLILFHVSLVSSLNSSLAELIERVHGESDSATLYFVKFDSEFLTQFSATHPQIPMVIISDLNHDWKNITSPVILVVQANLQVPNPRNQQIVEVLITKIQVRKFVIISAGSLEILKQQFSFFAEKKFTRVLGTVGNTPYAFLPYADERIKQLSKRDLLHLPNPLKNLNGFTFRTTIQKDIPRTFLYTDKRGRRRVGGCFGRLFAAFLRHHNATYSDILLNNSSQINIPAVKMATVEGKIDISFNAHPQGALDWSYPVKVVNWVLMVPINGYVSPNEYFKKPFSLSAWICIGLALVYITLMQIILNKLLERPADYWHSFSQTLLTMLMLSTEKRITSAYRVYLLTFLFSFIVCNIYVIFFTSFLTAFIPIKQFNTMDDLVENKFPILVSRIDWQHLSRPDNYPIEVRDLHVPIDHATYYKELHSMKNTSFAYTLGSDRSDFLVDMQASLEKPLFRKAHQVFEFYLVGYILPYNSPFKEILNDFVIGVKETGLMHKWDADVIRQAPLGGFEMLVNRSRGVNEKPAFVVLTVRHFEFAWICAGVGWTLSIFIFLGERVCGRFGFSTF